MEVIDLLDIDLVEFSFAAEELADQAGPSFVAEIDLALPSLPVEYMTKSFTTCRYILL